MRRGRRERGVRGAAMMTCVIMAAFNEEATVREAVERVVRAGYDKRIVAVDDGSTDGTADALAACAREHPGVVSVITHGSNRGKGASIRTALAHESARSADIVVIHDADLEYDPEDHRRVLGPIFDGDADVVYGSRFVGSRPHRVLFFWHRVANFALTTASNVMTNLNLTDMETCVKAFRRESLEGIRLRENGFGFEPEVTAKLARRGARFYEVGVAYRGRTYAQGKKIRWPDALRALWCIVRYNVLG